jgi:hypothetical protein
VSKLRGKLEHRDLEGGIFQLVGERGVRTTLIGAKDDLKRFVGAQVEIEGELEADSGFGFAMAGPLLRVGKVSKL